MPPRRGISRPARSSARAPSPTATPAAGCSCIAERRVRETIDSGKPVTPFMKFGDRIRIEMFDRAGQSIFGAIDQKVVRYTPPA